MKHNLKYVFFGTPGFAAIILEKLIEAGWPPLAIVCNPDRPIGRKKTITPPPTKVLAEKYAIKVYQPEKLEIEKLKLEIGEIDFAIVAAYAKIIPKEILTIPRLGVIGVHPSLLPKYRGSSPIQSVILNGDSETGVSLFLIDEQIDHGKTLSTIKYQILNNDNYEILNKKLAELGASLLIETLPKFIKNEITPLSQNENKATHTKKFITEDGYVDLRKDEPAVIERKIRALNPDPGVWTLANPAQIASPVQTKNFSENEKRVKLLEAELVDGKLKLTKIQVEGKKPRNISY